MEDLQIRWTQKTPSVECRSEDGYIRIEGQSIPENAQEFYERLWLHGRKVSVVWMYAEEDDDMREEGESYQKVVNFPIRLEAYAGERE